MSMALADISLATPSESLAITAGCVLFINHRSTWLARQDIQLASPHRGHRPSTIHAGVRVVPGELPDVHGRAAGGAERRIQRCVVRHAGDAIPAGGASILRVVSGKGCEQRGVASRGGNESACVQFATGFPARTRKPRNKSVATASSILALRGCGFGGLDYLLLRASLTL